MNPRTRLAILSSVNYNTGFAPPLAEVAEFLRARGVLLFIDGTQSVGALRFDAARVQPDMLAVHGYKWLLSPEWRGFFTSLRNCATGCSPTSSAGAAIATGAMSTICIMDCPN